MSTTMRSAGSIHPELPLALLQAVQSHDTPAELLPDEDLAAAFPHRLGLSDVVEEQIREFRRLARRKHRITEERLGALLELVARRPDASDVFETAGRQLARLRFSGFLGRLRRITRRLPVALRYRAAVRALRAAQGQIIVAPELSISASPFEMRAVDALTARIGEDGVACALYGSLASGLLELYGAGRDSVIHPHCHARGAPDCLWRLEPMDT